MKKTREPGVARCPKCHRIWDLSVLRERSDYVPGECPVCRIPLVAVYERREKRTYGLCGEEMTDDVVRWARDKRKPLEDIEYSACDLVNAETTAQTIIGDYQRVWDSAKLGRRVQIAQSAGWINAKGQLTRRGEKIAESKWDDLTPAAQNVIKSEIDILYERLTEEKHGVLKKYPPLSGKTKDPYK